MDRAKLKNELRRLIGEAPRIAPSISSYSPKDAYGKVTDEDLNTQEAVRWQLEAESAIKELASSGLDVFKGLELEHRRRKNESWGFHSRSIFVHKVLELLVTALQLLESALSN